MKVPKIITFMASLSDTSLTYCYGDLIK